MILSMALVIVRWGPVFVVEICSSFVPSRGMAPSLSSFGEGEIWADIFLHGARIEAARKTRIRVPVLSLLRGFPPSHSARALWASDSSTTDLNIMGLNACQCFNFPVIPHSQKDQQNQLSDIIQAGKTMAQVALNWCNAKPNVISIPKSDNVDRVVENCHASGWRLSAEQMTTLNKAFG